MASMMPMGKEGGGAMSCFINAEAAALLAVMRRNVRLSGAGVRYGSPDDDDDGVGDGRIDHPLVSSLKLLRRSLFSSSHPFPADPLRPFLDVVVSDEAGAPITGAALSSVHKLLSLGAILHPASLASVVDAVTACRFEVTDPASEEAVLMRILQLLLACVRTASASGPSLGDRHVCAAVNACFRIVHQAGTKSELLQRFARYTMHELVHTIFSGIHSAAEAGELGNANEVMGNSMRDVEVANGASKISDEIRPYGVSCMVDIFQFLCSLLNISEHMLNSTRLNPIAFDEDVPLFALGLINSAIELSGSSTRKHPKLLLLVQDELFGNLMQFGLSMSPLIVSTVCSIVLNLYHHLRMELKLQIEAFFSCVILRLAESRYGATYQQQEVAMEALVDFCRQDTFMMEMYANIDCDISCSNIFEDLTNLLSKGSFPVSGPVLTIHVIALEGLVTVVRGIAGRIGDSHFVSEEDTLDLEKYTPLWNIKWEDYTDPTKWIRFIRQRKCIKRRLAVGADHFNRDAKKGIEFLQGTHLLPAELDPTSVACFFRYVVGLDKNQIGDFLGSHDPFCIEVLHEFTRTFDFEDMNLDSALRLFLETFRLPGESQKIQRVLEAFAERYYEQSPHILANKDAALILSYSLILLNTDQHNVQVKKKMTEEDFIRNNRCINGGKDLPREILSELYHSICMNEIKTLPDQGPGFREMTFSRWADLIRKSKRTPPYIVCDSRPFLDQDMFAIMSGPTVVALSLAFENAEHEEVLHTCIDGFLAVAKISAWHHVVDVLDELVLSLCKSTTILDEDQDVDFGDNRKAMLATETLFKVANNYGDFIRKGWRNVVDCILVLYKLGLLPAHLSGNAGDDSVLPLNQADEVILHNTHSTHNIPLSSTHRKSSSFMGRFSQLLYLNAEETPSQPTEEQLVSRQRTLQTVKNCNIGNIFSESRFLQAESLMHLADALIRVAGPPQKALGSFDDEDTAMFCLELLIAIALNNRDRILLLWQVIYEHISGIVQSTVMPCALVEKAVFGLMRICQRLLPYKENLADDLLKSLQLILKLDARVADVYCENITQEVLGLVKANASHIKSQMGWRTIASLLSITSSHPDASDVGFEALVFIMSEGAHLSPANYILCIEASRQFAESRLGSADRSIRALDLMAESMGCLARWSDEAKGVGEEGEKITEGIREMWVRLVQALKKSCLDQREEVRNHALSSLQRCLVAVDGICLPASSWIQSFDNVTFPILDHLLEIALTRSQKDFRNIEASLLNAMKLMSKAFLQALQELSSVSSFPKLWLGVLDRMENYMKVKIRGRKSEKLQEMIPELLKNTLHVMKATQILVGKNTGEENNLWELTWPHVNKIDQSLQSLVFPSQERMEVVLPSNLKDKNTLIQTGPIPGGV